MVLTSALKRVWNEDEGVLTFEWILLVTVLILGIVGGLSAVRDAIIDELGDVGGAIIAVDQSWTIEPSPCDPCHFDFGHFDDDHPTVHRGRPAVCP
jgi:Flp pilus assembly pilin Flp